MNLVSMSSQNDVQLVISQDGLAMLLHDGKIPNDYDWVQYDPHERSIQFITPTGYIQCTGLNIDHHIDALLRPLNGIMMIEVYKDQAGEARDLKFLTVAE